MAAMRIVARLIRNAGEQRHREHTAQRWLLRVAAVGAGAGLLVALGVAAAVLVHPPLFADLRPWWPPLAAIGLISTAASYWLLWGRGR